MEKQNSSDLEVKYQKLALEFSKIRSHATVLKKALLDEQAKNVEMKDTLKKHEQQLRKQTQEMDSLMFRNEQLSKRIAVLQQELLQSNNKKGKLKSNNVTYPEQNTSLIDEELQKKIIENAQLLSTMTDKDLEITDLKEKIDWLESKLQNTQKSCEEMESKFSDAVTKLKKERSSREKQSLQVDVQSESSVDSSRGSKEDLEESKKNKFWQEEAERWKTECEILRAKPSVNEELTEYYESQIREMLEAKQMCLSETKTLWAENTALSRRLEGIILDYKEVENQLESHKDDMKLTSENYKSQLDAMTEHLAAQNDKITKQTDEIEMLKHKLVNRK